MAITTRDYKLQTTSFVSNLSGSSTGMPDGMTSSISSDGTTFLLNGDDSYVSSEASGNIVMTATGLDDLGNVRSASASVPGQIIGNDYKKVSYEINEIYNHETELVGAILAEITFSTNFHFNDISTEIIKTINFTNNNKITIQQLKGNNPPLDYGEVVLHDNGVDNMLVQCGVEGTNIGTDYENDYNDMYGSWNKDNKTGTGAGDFDNVLAVSSFNFNTTNFDKQGTITLTFYIFKPSSFALKMN